MNDDRSLVQHQLSTLALLDPIARSAAGGGFAFVLAGLAAAIPGLKLLGLALLSDGSSMFVYRMARMPIWVCVLMGVIATFFAVLGIRMSLGQKNAASKVLAHLRAHSDDPFVHLDIQAQVNRGYRSTWLTFTSRRGVVVQEMVPMSHESAACAAAEQAVRT
jgi:hypothetical protein